MSHHEFERKRGLLSLLVSIAEARAAALERVVETRSDGSQIVADAGGRRWRVWHDERGDRHASPELD